MSESPATVYPLTPRVRKRFFNLTCYACDETTTFNITASQTPEDDQVCPTCKTFLSITDETEYLVQGGDDA